MKKTVIASAICLLFAATAFAQEPTIKFYGFVRNYFSLDSRSSSAGTADNYYYMPLDENIVDGEDLNAVPTARFNALTSRIGLDVKGYEYDGYKIGAKIETDFYSGLSGVTGTATLRLRQAFVTVAKDKRSWKIGQAWHPMAADLPDIFSLESGAPFGPFSRTPQVAFDRKMNGGFTFNAAALWQMQYTCTGPEGASANYIKYGCTPELYLGFSQKQGDNLVRFGVDLLSIKPRQYGYNAGTKVLVDDRLTTLTMFAYEQFNSDDWTLRVKYTYAQDGSHMNMVGGYGVCEIEDDGSWNYTPTRTTSAWFTAMYKGFGSWKPAVFVGFLENLGTSEDVVSNAEVKLSSLDLTSSAFYKKLNANTVKMMYRIQPEIVYSIGPKFQIGFEYMLTAVQYGTPDSKMCPVDNLHWITNHRLQSLVKYTF